MSDFNIGSLENSSTYVGNVLSADPTDIYRLTLDAPGSFSLSLGELSADADIKLLDSTGSVVYASSNSGTSPEAINIDQLIAPGDYSIEISRVSDDTDYILEVSPKTNTDPLTGQPLAPSNNSPFESGVFKVGPTGKVDLSYLFDGGFYEGEVGIFKLEGMSAFLTDYSAFAKEAARRALTNSSLGHTVISDFTEGAKLTGVLGAEPQNWNKGTYPGIKTVYMNPGDEFGIILAPRNKIQDVFNNPALTGTRRPLFSLATSNPRDAFNSGQIADVTGNGYAFALEDMQVNAGADRDYNDVMFQVAGATGKAPSLNNVIAPSPDWRGTALGGQILDEINSADTEPPEIAAYLANDTGEDTADGITSDPTIAGSVIDVSGIFSLRAGFEGMPVESFTEIASRLAEDGTFSLDRDALEEIFGGALSEESHTLYLRAIDENGNVSGFEGIRFTLEPATNDSGSLDSEVQFSVDLAQLYGLDPYPDAISLPVGGTRQLSVKVNELPNSPDLNTDESGTRYEVSDPSVLSVSEDGLVTALKSGDATVTVSNGSAVEVIPIRVQNPQLGPATLGADGGVVRASDGSMVMVAPGALDEDTTVSLTPLSREDLSLPIPEGFEIAGAFNLDAGDDPMNVPAQLAIPAPAGLPAGTEVYFMRKGALPDETGTWNPIWLQEESGVVGADGMIRTSSPPWPGVVRPGEYIVVYSGPTGSATLVKGQLTLNYNFPVAFFGVISPGGIGQLLMPDQFGSANVALTVSYDISSVKVMAVPVAGLPVITEVGVQRNQDGIASLRAALNMPAPAESDPTAPPVLLEAELKFADENNQPFENNQPVLFLTGSNVLVNSGSDLLGSRFEDLVAKFYVGNTAYEGTVLPNLSRELGDNRFEVAVKVPNTVPLGASRIVLTRRQNHLAGQNGTEPVYEEVEYDSNNIRLNQGAEYIFAAQRGADQLAVLDGTDPESVVEASNSSNLLLARIPVGTPELTDRPRASAVTSDGTRVYVVLESTGRVALVDPLVLQQVDTQPDIQGINPIDLPAGAVPWSIAINSRNEYAYIADSARGNIYILDINPFSETYHQVIQTITVNPASSGLRQMAISSDGRKLFVTAPNGYIYVINIDGQDRPTDPNQNERKWHEQIGAVVTVLQPPLVTEGIAATSDPLKMTFTSPFSDSNGFGVLEITNNDPTNFAATTRYAGLTMGVVSDWLDYFDVNRGVAVTVTRDGSYAFVAGRNDSTQRNVESISGVRAGSNIGIIKDPLGPEPKLIAATRPIPQGDTTSLALSNDNKYLYASYPGRSGSGSVFVFDVEEILKTLSNPGDYKIDSLDRGTGSPFFNAATGRSATASDFVRVPIDDINPAISIAADYEIVAENRPANQFTYGVPDNTTRGPIATGGSPWGLSAAPADWLDLAEVQWKKEPVAVPEFVPTPAPPEVVIPILIWTIINTLDVVEVNLTISAFPEGEGLFPGEDSFVERPLPPGLDENKLKKSTSGVADYNPNRNLTATWRVIDVANGLGQWEVAGKIIEELVPNNQFPFADLLNLTRGQTYYWGVQAKSLTRGTIRQSDGQFYLPLAPAAAPAPETYSSVTFLTPDGMAFDPKGLFSAREIAGSIAGNIDGQGTDGTVMQYLPDSGEWQVLSGDGGLGKPLVLVADWSQDSTADKLNSGFSEAAADALFASLVGLNQSYGEAEGTPKDALFNSPMHFIGFGRGAVVNSEIIQRLGTFFPKDTHPAMFPDLQMTTVDPNDFAQELNSQTLNYFDPQVQVWENVTFADNYYQTATTSKPRGRDLVNIIPSEWLPPDSDTNENRADLSVHLGGFDESGNLSPSSRAGFTQDVKDGNNPHGRTVAWYGGTVDLSWGKDNPLGYPIHRRSGDFSYGELFDPNFPDAKPWYTPNHTGQPVGDEDAQWEGIGTGWYYSVLGGGSHKRSLLPPVASERTPVYFDNTYDAGMRGDYAVPTVFNGNFDAIAYKIDSQPIPGWSLHNGGSGNEALQKYLVDRKDIPTLEELDQPEVSPTAKKPNYTIKLDGELSSITRNLGVVPDWGALRFDLHAPGVKKASSGQLFFTVRPLDSQITPFQGVINLEKAENGLDGNGSPLTYNLDRFRIDYGTKGFESFYIDIPERLRNKPVYIDFQLEGTGKSKPTVYLDDILFQSDALKFGNPTAARTLTNSHQTNYLIEKPQYTISYNSQKNTPNWVGWVLDKSWATGGVGRAAEKFAEDPQLPLSTFYRVQHGDYDFESQIENKYIFDEYNSFSWGKKAFFWPARGHLAASADRQRSKKDNLATFLTANIIPQDIKQNSGVWRVQEERLQNLARNGYKFLLFAGGFGQGGGKVTYGPLPTDEKSENVKGVTPIERGDPNPNQFANLSAATDATQATKIQVPDALWKAVLGFSPSNKSGTPDIHFAWWIPNNSYAIQKKIDYTKPTPYPPDNQLGPTTETRAWNEEAYTITIEALEGRLNKGLAKDKQYDFLSNLKAPAIKKKLKEIKALLPSTSELDFPSS